MEGVSLPGLAWALGGLAQRRVAALYRTTRAEANRGICRTRDGLTAERVPAVPQAANTRPEWASWDLHADCLFHHWGDRDPGGLRIYAKVAAACPAHGVSPHLMTVPDSGHGDWTPDQHRALEQVIAQGGAAGRLAEEWIAQGLGPLEQEALDPKAPGEEGCEAGARVP